MVRYTEILSDTTAEEQRSRSMREAEVPIYSCVSVIGDRATERERQEERKKRKGEEGRRNKGRRKKKRKRRKKKKEAIFCLAKTFGAFKLVTR